MKTYAYVRASAPADDKSLVTFDHTFIMNARSEQDAYRLGQDYAPLMFGYVLLNDYVFEGKP